MISFEFEYEVNHESNTYRLKFDKEYTVNEFIDEILKSHSDECGYIDIQTSLAPQTAKYISCEYQHGKLINDAVLSSSGAVFHHKKIKSARAYGGWGRMDYDLTIT